MDLERCDKDACNKMFAIINTRLKLEGREKIQTKRSFNTEWKPDGLVYRMFILLYEELTIDKGKNEIDIFNKEIDDRDEEIAKLKKNVEQHEKQITGLKNQKNSLKQEVNSEQSLLKIEQNRHTTDLDLITSLKKQLKNYESMIKIKDTSINGLKNEISILNTNLNDEKEFTMAVRRRGLNETEPLQSETVICKASVIEESKFTKYIKMIGNKFKRKEHRE